MQEYYSDAKDATTKIIGFVGCEKHDLIMYLASILQQMKESVILIDLTDEGALSECIQDVNISQEEITQPCIMDYRGIHYVPRFEHWQLRMDIITPYLYHEDHEYKYVLVDFGYQTGHTALSQCDLIVSVSDMQKHNIIRIQSLMEVEGIHPIIVLRDVINCKIKPTDMIPKEYLDKENVTVLEFDIFDFIGRIQMQYSKQLHTARVSKQLQNLLFNITQVVKPEVNEKELSAAMVRVKRGR